MKIFRKFLLLALIGFAFSVNAESNDTGTTTTEGETSDYSSRCPLKGYYSYELRGVVGPTSPASISLNEVGTIFFDGKGQGDGTGRTTISINPFVLSADYEFTYQKVARNIILATGTRTSELGTTSIRFFVSYGDNADHISLLVLPNPVPVRQPPQSIFNFVQVSGQGGL